MSTAGTVCAVVLTYNRREALRTCLTHLRGQTRAPDHILVVDNGSIDGTLDLLSREWPGVEVLALGRNLGAAGGFEAGMAHAYAAGFDWLWVMDDDVFPRPDALECLLAHAPEADVLVPWQHSQRDGLFGAARWTPRGVVAVPVAEVDGPRDIQLFAVAGPLFSRRVLARVGLPYAEYFIDMFDWEYALRVHQSGLRALLVPGSVVDHDGSFEMKPQRLFGITSPRPRYWRPTWRMYYDTRNALLTYRRRNLGWAYTVRHLLAQPRAALRELALGEGLGRVRWRLQANLDGLRGVTGERPGLRTPTAQPPAAPLPGKPV